MCGTWWWGTWKLRKGYSRVRVSRRRGGIFGFKWEHLAFARRRMHIDKLIDLHNSPTVVWGIWWRGVGSACHVESMEARREVTGILWRTRSLRDHMASLGIDRRIILNLTFMEVWGTCTIFVCLWFGEGVQFMTMWWWTFKFDEMREICDLPVGLLACQDGFCPMQSATCLTFAGPNSSYIPLRCTLYQVQSHAQTHTEFYEVFRLVIAKHMLSCGWHYTLEIKNALKINLNQTLRKE